MIQSYCVRTAAWRRDGSMVHSSHRSRPVSSTPNSSASWTPGTAATSPPPPHRTDHFRGRRAHLTWRGNEPHHEPLLVTDGIKVWVLTRDNQTSTGGNKSMVQTVLNLLGAVQTYVTLPREEWGQPMCDRPVFVLQNGGECLISLSFALRYV